MLRRAGVQMCDWVKDAQRRGWMRMEWHGRGASQLLLRLDWPAGPLCPEYRIAPWAGGGCPSSPSPGGRQRRAHQSALFFKWNTSNAAASPQPPSSAHESLQPNFHWRCRFYLRSHQSRARYDAMCEAPQTVHTAFFRRALKVECACLSFVDLS